MSRPASEPDVLLINPWIYDFAAFDFWFKPLGLLIIASVLRERTTARLHWIDCLDRAHPAVRGRSRSTPDGRGSFHKEEAAKPAVLKDVPRRFSRYGLPVEAFEAELDRIPTPAAVLLTCTMTYWYPGVQAVVEIVRRKFGAVPVILGGIYATLCAEHARSHSEADVVLSGPGENTILTVLREILGDAAVRDGASIDSIAAWPSPAFDLLGSKDVLPVQTSRGCPSRCSFCASRLLFDGFEERLPEAAAGDVAAAHALFGTRHFAFYDDALLLNKRMRIVPFLEDIARRDLGLAFHTPNGLHVREVDAGLARLFKRAGVESIFLSQESSNPDVLRQACPKVEADDLGRAAAALEQAGFRRGDLNVYLIAGLPGQSAESIRVDIRFVHELGLRPRLAHFSPIPGTPAWADLVRAGRLRPDADPLLHNKAAFPYLGGTIDPQTWESLLREAALPVQERR